jgi:methionyl-tRNA synthetase
LVNEYGTDAVRYFFLRELNPSEDGDFTFEKMKEAYNANLANGLGNLASRIMKMAEDNLESAPEIPEESIPQEYKDFMYAFEYQKAMDFIWQKIGYLDARIQKEEPFKLVKVNKEEGIEIIKQLAVELYTIGRMLYPFMPDTNVKIKEMVKANKKPVTPIFARKD